MQKQTNSAPSVPLTLKFCPWNSERTVLSALTVRLEKPIIWIMNWKVKPYSQCSACTKLYIKFLIIVCNIFMIIFRNYFWNLLSCPYYFKMRLFWSKACYFRNFGQICIQGHEHNPSRILHVTQLKWQFLNLIICYLWTLIYHIPTYFSSYNFWSASLSALISMLQFITALPASKIDKHTLNLYLGTFSSLRP